MTIPTTYIPPEGKQYFWPLETYGWISEVKAAYPTIRRELKQLLAQRQYNWFGSYADYVETKDELGWKLFAFHFFGIQHQGACSLCPETAKVLSRIPHLVSAKFSWLTPGTYIKPHVGYTQRMLRSHLGLIIPGNNDCYLKVIDETRYWQEGEMLIFNNCFIHEAENPTDQDRVILMIDTLEPGVADETTVKELCREKLATMNDDKLFSIAPREEWLKWLEKGVFPKEFYQ